MPKCTSHTFTNNLNYQRLAPCTLVLLLLAHFPFLPIYSLVSIHLVLLVPPSPISWVLLPFHKHREHKCEVFVFIYFEAIDLHSLGLLINYTEECKNNLEEKALLFQRSEHRGYILLLMYIWIIYWFQCNTNYKIQLICMYCQS